MSRPQTSSSILVQRALWQTNFSDLCGIVFKQTRGVGTLKDLLGCELSLLNDLACSVVRLSVVGRCSASRKRRPVFRSGGL